MTLNEAVKYHTRHQNCTLFLRNLRHTYPADEVEKDQHSQACISEVWGCINAHGVGSLHMRKSNINAGKACPCFTATCAPVRIIVGSLYSPHNSWSTPIRLSVI